MGSYITCTLTLFSQFETLSKVEPASVRGWLCNINSPCCCFCLMFSDSLAGSVLCLRGHMKRTLELIEDKYAQRFADCFPLLRYFQHLSVTMASAAPNILLIAFEWFDLSPRSYLWVFGTTPCTALSVAHFCFPKLFCVLPSWCPQSGTGQTVAFCKGWHPARRPFSVGTKPNRSLQICFSVVYISVSRLLYTCT